jgi:hypothetical protein
MEVQPADVQPVPEQRNYHCPEVHLTGVFITIALGHTNSALYIQIPPGEHQHAVCCIEGMICNVAPI